MKWYAFGEARPIYDFPVIIVDAHYFQKMEGVLSRAQDIWKDDHWRTKNHGNMLPNECDRWTYDIRSAKEDLGKVREEIKKLELKKRILENGQKNKSDREGSSQEKQST